MMVFMLILKIIGIVLCVIIGILAMILFVPVCYKVDADIDEMDYTVRARWLGWLIRFEFRWKEKAHAVLKILWFVIDLTDPEAVAVRKANKEVKARKSRKRSKRRKCAKAGKSSVRSGKKKYSRYQNRKNVQSSGKSFEDSRKQKSFLMPIENAQDSKGETAEAEPEMAGTDVNAEKYTSEVNEKNASEEPDILNQSQKPGMVQKKKSLY